ncbi:adenylate kinase [Bulleidia sp. zg-1006]|uniref:adenylate kinase n=1 Tax=Bulleidia sp. zg-1006 TaxID=2806552 RepID=UPI00193A02B5|nr:adenylate kinase [Bulleidia sp. zg-1006]QRG86608.1 adenylate kinase [Bulleidia sp. zg-1006]
MNILIMGPAGAGKGTMSKEIKRKYNVPHISTGDMFRENIKKNTPLGVKAKEYMEAGKLVPDSLVNDMVEDRLRQDDCANGYLLDGFPRSLGQAEALTEITNKIHRSVDVALVLGVDIRVLEQRITGRRICKNCGSIYHIKNHPSKVEGVCDVCGSELTQRKDDTLEQLQVRMDEYRNQTEPVIQYYEKQGIAKYVDAGQQPEKVFADIQSILDAVK